jgi:cytochrome c peroxidase
MKNILFAFATITFCSVACDPEPKFVEPTAVFDSTPFDLKIGDFPTPNLPTDNKLTVAKIQLGRLLFFEKMLSRDGSQACADCHKQADGFSDIRRFSVGVEKKLGTRQAMALMNLGWHQNGFFWDGRTATLREQALKPIQDPLEMNETLPNVIAKLSASQTYKDQFTRAFGAPSVSAAKMGLAMEQFMLTMVSNNAKFDKFKRKEVTLTDAEERGRALFFTEFDPIGTQKGAECFHCHGGQNFTNDEFMNNGLDADAQMTDNGRMNVTKKTTDRAKFKVPSLRNIALTPPYMHDGRFTTLEEVINHYDRGAKPSSTIDILMQYNIQPNGLGLTAQNKSDLIAFLNTLTDTDFLTNKALSKP